MIESRDRVSQGPKRNIHFGGVVGGEVDTQLSAPQAVDEPADRDRERSRRSETGPKGPAARMPR